MKKLFTAVLLICSMSLTAYSQTSQIQKLNLDFEQSTDGYPDEWNDFGSKSYLVYTDSVSPFKGKYSVVIENKSAVSNFKALTITLPENYKGEFIHLSGYIKTENVTD